MFINAMNIEIVQDESVGNNDNVVKANELDYEKELTQASTVQADENYTGTSLNSILEEPSATSNVFRRWSKKPVV